MNDWTLAMRPGERRLADGLTALAVQAAAAILAAGSAHARMKADASPVTAADEASETLILQGLARALPGVPVVSEESAATHVRAEEAGQFILVDPLDGTREFIAGRPEFTVNIALIEGGRPVFGVIAAPALSLVWRGAPGLFAERLPFADGRLGAPTAIRVRALPSDAPLALTSRSHLDPRTAALLARVPGVRQEACGSALKFCRLAEGAADFYPRLAPTSAWDVAAGDAVLAAAGGSVETPAGAPLGYGPGAGALRVPEFIAYGDRAAARHVLALDLPPEPIR